MLNDEQSMLQRFKRGLSKNSINQRELRARQWRGTVERICIFATKASESCRILIYRTGTFDVAEIMMLTYLRETEVKTTLTVIIRKLKTFLTIESLSFPCR